MPRRSTKLDFAHSLVSNSGVSVGPTATSIPVVDGSQFPDTTGGKFTIRFPSTGEVCRVNTRVGNVFTSVTRGLPEGKAGTYSGTTILDGSEVDEIWGAQDIADTEDYLPPIDASNITSGTISSARLPANVSSIKKTGSSALTGDVTLTGGTGVTLTQAGQDISISASAGGGSGTVTSVGLSLPADFTISGSPVTGSGTLTAVRNTQNANTIFAGPTTGSPASPTYRLLVASDLPAATTSTQGAVTLANVTPSADGTGAIGTATAAARADHVHPLVTSFTTEVTVPDLKVTGLTGSVQAMRVVGATSSGAPTTGAHLVGDASLSLADGKWYVCTVAGTPGTFVSAAGSGTVTSVGLTVPSALLNVSGSPITGSGTLAVSLATQSANTVLAGPTTGSSATPTMRALVAADLPDATTSAIGAELIDQAPPSGHPRSLTTMNRNVGNGLASVGYDGMLSSMYDQTEGAMGLIAETARWTADIFLFGGTGTSAAQEPCVIVENNTIKLWWTHEAGLGNTARLAYATCTGDPTVSGNWTQVGDVLGGGVGGYSGWLAHPSVTKIDGVYHLYIADDNNGNLLHSTSTNGTTWTTPTIVIAQAAVGWSAGWDKTYVWQEGATWYALLEGFSSGSFLTTLATSVDGLTWTFPNASFISSLRPNGGTGTNSSGCMMFPQKRNGLYHLWFHGSTSTANLPTDIYHATSPDLATWTILNSGNPIISRPSVSYDQVADPCLFEWHGKTYMLYERVLNSANRFELCIAWAPCTVAQLIDGTQIVNGNATTTADGLVRVDNNSSGDPVAVTVAGYLASLTGLTHSNLDAAAAILLSQLGQSGASVGQVPTWSGAAYTPATPPSAVVYGPLVDSAHNFMFDSAGTLILAPR